MEQLGCTSPFGPNKSNICTDKNDRDLADQLYQDYFYRYQNNCIHSCNLLSIRYNKQREFPNEPDFGAEGQQDANKSFSSRLVLLFQE